ESVRLTRQGYPGRRSSAMRRTMPCAASSSFESAKRWLKCSARRPVMRKLMGLSSIAFVARIKAHSAAAALSGSAAQIGFAMLLCRHETAERRQPFGETLVAEMAGPTLELVGGAVETRPPLDERLTARDDGQDADRRRVVAHRIGRRVAERIGVG